MLIRRASDLSLQEALIVAAGVLDGNHRLMSSIMFLTINQANDDSSMSGTHG
jgi:hypothetical protein